MIAFSIRASRCFTGAAGSRAVRSRGKGVTDIAWFQPDGSDMSSEEWGQWFAKSFAVFLFGEGLLSRDERGCPEHDASFLILANAHTDVVQFTLPARRSAARWAVEIDTVDGRVGVKPSEKASTPARNWIAPACRCMVLRAKR